MATEKGKEYSARDNTASASTDDVIACPRVIEEQSTVAVATESRSQLKDSDECDQQWMGCACRNIGSPATAAANVGALLATMHNATPMMQVGSSTHTDATLMQGDTTAVINTTGGTKINLTANHIVPSQ
jgi:hypothetical protein